MEGKGRLTRLVRIGSRGQQEGSRKMRSNRRRNWLIKRIALGFAVAAFVAPAAQARVDESSIVQAHTYQPAQVVQDYQPFATDFPSSPAVGSTDPGIVATPSGYQAFVSDFPRSTRDQIEVVRAEPRSAPSDKIEFIRTQPRSVGEPQVVAAGFDWKDAGVGAGLALALVLLGGGAALASRHVGRAQTA
jgi:hypothetical protein